MIDESGRAGRRILNGCENYNDLRFLSVVTDAVAIIYGVTGHGGNDMEIVILLAVISTVLYTLRRYAVEFFYRLRPLIHLLLSHEQGDGCFQSKLLRTVLRGCGVGENLSTVKYQCRFSGRAGGRLLVPPVEEFLGTQ